MSDANGTTPEEGTVPTPDMVLAPAGDMFNFLAQNDEAREALYVWLVENGLMPKMSDEEKEIFRTNLPVLAQWAHKFALDARTAYRMAEMVGGIGIIRELLGDDGPFSGPVGDDYLDSGVIPDDFVDEDGEIHIDRKPEH